MIKNININFWNNFYKKKTNLRPSSFAKFIAKNFPKENHLIEFGCGNGRDSFYLSKNFKSVISIDKSKIAIEKNNELLKKLKIKNLKFINLDLEKKRFNFIKKINLVYARFFVHSVNLRAEKKIFLQLKKLLKSKSSVVLEFRTTQDKMYNFGKKISKYERYTDHYRRFIKVDDFLKRVKKSFKIEYLIQSKNLSIVGNDNPYLCRIILKKK